MTELTYAEVGATQSGELPDGYDHLRYRTRVGSGVLALAGEAIVTWRLHRAAGVRIDANAERAAPGVLVTSRLLWLRAPCAVVWAVADERQIGFAYGTLPGHPECGEESFLVEREGDDVWFSVTAFSRPALWYTKLGGPAVGILQRAYARRLGAVLRRICAEG